MEILLLLGLGFLLLCFGKKPGKDSGNAGQSTTSPFQEQAKKKKKQKQKDEEEFWDMMMALDDEDEMDGL